MQLPIHALPRVLPQQQTKQNSLPHAYVPSFEGGTELACLAVLF